MKPKKLNNNFNIGIFSSSSPISATVPTRYERGKQYLISKGITVIDGSLYRKKDSYRSGTIKERAEEFNKLLYDDNIHILMSSIGGYNSNSILPYIDYEYLKQHPKIIIGYSDTTALLMGIFAKTGLTTFYGPALASSFGEFPPFVDWTYENFKSIICNEINIPYEYKMPQVWTDEFIDWDKQNGSKTQYKNEWISVIPGTAEGRLIGGNLNTMMGFFGTEYMPKIQDGDILLIEDSFKDACTIERSFSMLNLSGIFDKIGGIILGKHEQFNDNGTGKKPYEILLEILDDRKIPFIADFDCCHTHPMLTLPLGCKVKLDSQNKKVILLEHPFEQ